MTAVPDADVITTPATMLTFLRGVERRSLVLAQLQCADADVAEGVLDAASELFCKQAGEWLMATWPLRFWSLLTASPVLRRSPMPGNWQAPFAVLGSIDSEDRLALLLRIVAGLDERMAADVMGLDQAHYRQALARACPRDAAGEPDALAWRALAEAAQLQIRALPPQRLGLLQRLQPSVADAAPRLRANDPLVRPRRHERRKRVQRWPQQAWWRNALVLAAVLALVLGAWWWHKRAPAVVADSDAEAALVQVEDLPADDDLPPPLPTPPISAADQAMLSDPELETVREGGFYAWLAAGSPLPVDESESRVNAAEPASSGLETVDDAN